ncbi:hypothetical protein [Occultella kanbiaonis]|uniref:hypothetical protein n=1 Tax=Occultella kanbiaonis TaxID=2675754 RepID=UPI001E3271DB|nr:hypothetical protein [Occultella kanbiaonis]
MREHDDQGEVELGDSELHGCGRILVGDLPDVAHDEKVAQTTVELDLKSATSSGCFALIPGRDRVANG